MDDGSIRPAAGTGEAIWAYQSSPHDDYDYDGINECVLVDITVKGQKRKVLLHPDRNGHLYEIDRTTGEVILAEPYAFTNTTNGVDMKTRAPKHGEGEIARIGAYRS